MRLLGILVASAILIACSPQPTPMPGPPSKGSNPNLVWAEYKSDLGGFSVLFPGEVQTTKDDPTVFSTEGISSGFAYIYTVGISDFDPPFTDANSKLKELARKSENKILSETSLTVQGKPALETLEESGHSIIRTRTIAINNKRLYVLVVIMDPKAYYAADVQKFLDSFQLLKP